MSRSFGQVRGTPWARGPFPGGASNYLLAWPALRNFRVYRGSYPELRYWIDPTKKPL